MSFHFPEVDLTDVRGVLIDIDNTLYPVVPADQGGTRLAHTEFEKLFGEISYESFRKEYRAARSEVTQRLSPQGPCRSRLFAFHLMLLERKVPRAFNLALDFEKLYWKGFFNQMVLDERAERFLKVCHEKKLPVCAVTDMQAHYQIEKLKILEVDRYIDFLVTSEEAGCEKPNRPIFEFALSRIGLPATDVIMIGDNQEKDIVGADQMGIRSFLVEAEQI